MDVMHGAVETRTKEEEGDNTRIQIAVDLKENVTVVAWKLIMHCHAILSSNSGRHFSTWELILMRERKRRSTSRKTNPIQKIGAFYAPSRIQYLFRTWRQTKTFLDIVEGEEEVFTPHY